MSRRAGADAVHESRDDAWELTLVPDPGEYWNLLETTGSLYRTLVTQEREALERRIERLRGRVRQAVASGERDRAKGLRAELREAERQWDEALTRLEAESPDPAAGLGAPGTTEADKVSQRSSAQATEAGRGTLLPAREQVHQALTLLGGPAAPKLIVAVHDAFYAGSLPAARLTSLRRDEERSFRSAPHARPYYICAALTADLLAPARGLLAVSAWPMDRRIVGPLSPRVDYLIAAIRIAERFRDRDNSGASADSRRLLWRFAANIPHAASNISRMDPDEIVIAARAELAVHERADSDLRTAAAARARAQLDDAEQLFGAGLRVSRSASGDG